MIIYSALHTFRTVNGILGAGGALTATTKITYIVTSIFLVLLAGLVSGLTIGLLSLDKLQMEVLLAYNNMHVYFFILISVLGNNNKLI